MDFRAPKELYNPLSKTVPRKYHGSGGQSKCNCLQDRANFHRSRAWQNFLIFNTEVMHDDNYSGRASVASLALEQSCYQPSAREVTLRKLYIKTHHDDVIKWKHFPRYWPFVRGIHRSPVNSPHKGQWRGALMFTLISARINGWVNNREAGDLRHHRAHYDVIVMMKYTWVKLTVTKPQENTTKHHV